MTNFDDQVRKHIAGLSEKDLIKMLAASADEYLPEAFAFAKGEAQRRGIKDISVDAIDRLEQEEALRAEQTQPVTPKKKLSHTMPHSLGLVLGVSASVLVGGREATAAVSFLGYLVGAVLGYVIESRNISRAWKNGLSIIVGLLIFFGFVGFKSYQNVIRMVDPYGIKAVFPGVSDQALRDFNQRVSNSATPSPGLGREIFETLSRGEVLLSQTERDEMVELHWKAVATLPHKDQALVTLHSMGVKSDKDYSPDAQAKISALVQQAFQDLSPEDHKRYMALKRKSFELGVQTSK